MKSIEVKLLDLFSIMANNLDTNVSNTNNCNQPFLQAVPEYFLRYTKCSVVDCNVDSIETLKTLHKKNLQGFASPIPTVTGIDIYVGRG